MTLTTFGAAGDVTGSAYLLETSDARLLVDFGLFQGNRELEAKNIVPDDIHSRELDCVLLTHGHLDHCGRLPMLIRRGFVGPIHATSATIEMAALVMHDCARIMESDFERKCRKAKKKGYKVCRDDAPLYEEEDVDQTVRLMRPVEYGVSMRVAEGITAVYHEAGHMLGSASIELVVVEGEVTNRVVFSGDIGPRGLPFLRDPAPPHGADVLIMESTYGDREHRSLAETLRELAEIVNDAVAHHGKIFIPSFAIGRTQQLLYHFAELVRDGVIPQIPVYVDSPMGISATHIYERYPELFDVETKELSSSGSFAKFLKGVRATATREESQAINSHHGSCIVIAGSGMATAGRILHHLRQNLDDPTAHVVIVGYQARGTLGRKLVDRQEIVSVLGDKIRVQAKVHTLGGLSAHAGKSELLQWYSAASTPQTTVFLTHGEDSARLALSQTISELSGKNPLLPTYAEQFSL